MSILLTRSSSNALPVNYELRTKRHAFRIVKKIATGGFGITYQVENLIDFTISGTSHVVPKGAFLALKECFKRGVMIRTPQGNAVPARGCESKVKTLRAQFLNEAFTIMRLQQLSPPEMRANAELLGYVPIFHAGTAKIQQSMENVHYFVMPYLIGGTLKSQLQVLNPHLIVWITYRLLRALQLLHNDRTQTPPTLHHDIKPANIMLTETFAPVLIDFGISSGTENIGGTPDYTPYEQMTNSNTGRYSDLYALGATIYEIITGNKVPQFRNRPPYTHNDPYVPLADMPDVIERFRPCSNEYETAYLQNMQKPYDGQNQSFGQIFLRAIDIALRTETTGYYGRWQFATQWLDDVFKGMSPIRPVISQITSQKHVESSHSIWIPNVPMTPRKKESSRSTVTYAINILLIILVVLLIYLVFLICTDFGIITTYSI